LALRRSVRLPRREKTETHADRPEKYVTVTQDGIGLKRRIRTCPERPGRTLLKAGSKEVWLFPARTSEHMPLESPPQRRKSVMKRRNEII